LSIIVIINAVLIYGLDTSVKAFIRAFNARASQGSADGDSMLVHLELMIYLLVSRVQFNEPFIDLLLLIVYLP
jgi:hypothetical protein